MSVRAAGVTVLRVLHRSGVAAIATAAGPDRLLEAGLAEAMEASGLSVRIVDVSPPPDGPPGEVARSFRVADRVAREVRNALEAGDVAVVLSGSCHTALGSVSGIPAEARGVVWLDAHGDFNTPETTGSGLLDGMTLAAVTGRCWTRLNEGVEGYSPVPDENVLLIGARSLDEDEAALLGDSNVDLIPTEDVPARAEDALRALGKRGEGVYLHVDLDVLDPSVGMANAYATEGGLSTDELRSLVETAVAHCPVRVIGFTSYDPATDVDGGVRRAAVEAAGGFAAAGRRD